MNKLKYTNITCSTPPSGGRGAKKYKSPRIEWILLDNEISLALQSNPPSGPNEVFNSVQNPFKEDSGLV